MSTFNALIDRVLAQVEGYGSTNPRSGWTSQPIDTLDLTIPLSDAPTGIPGEGLAEIGDELVYVRQWDADTKTLLLAPDGRGYQGTIAAAYDAGTRVRLNPPWARRQVRTALEDAIRRSFPTIYGVKTSTFTFTATQYVYVLPDEAESVLQVAVQDNGPRREWTEYNHWDFNGASDVDMPNSLTIGMPLRPGSQFKVTYSCRPPVPTSTTDDVYDITGLSTSFEQGLIFGACSHLMQFVDASRIHPHTAQSDAVDQNASRRVGVATSLAQSFEQRFQLELVSERQRLRKANPVRARFVGRR